MVLELQEPFSSMWRKGYLRVGSEGRRLVDLYNLDNDRTTISYARYLMSVHLGYIVPDHLEVDHKNNDPTDDRIDNFQLLTSEQNLLKKQYNYVMNEQICYGFYCAYCETPFILIEREVKKRIHCGVEMAFCSRSCSAKYHYHVTGRSNNNGAIPEQPSKL